MILESLGETLESSLAGAHRERIVKASESSVSVHMGNASALSLTILPIQTQPKCWQECRAIGTLLNCWWECNKLAWKAFLMFH